MIEKLRRVKVADEHVVDHVGVCLFFRRIGDLHEVFIFCVIQIRHVAVHDRDAG